jgi:hypothetical protein
LQTVDCLRVVQPTVRCQVAAAALGRADGATIAALRRQPLVFGAQKLAASVLQHAEDQTILALRTVLDAIDEPYRHDRAFASWGVIAAPMFFGRLANAQAAQRFRDEGPWGVSPHLIPNLSLHGLSGTISQFLKIHGPNFGVGGGSNCAPEVFLLAAGLLAGGSLPGLWVILTGHESEWIPSVGHAETPPLCRCLVLALAPTLEMDGPHLSIGQAATADVDDALAHGQEFSFAGFAEEWTAMSALPVGRWRLGERHWLAIGSEGRA